MADDLIERLKATEGHTPGPWWSQISDGRKTRCVVSVDTWICGEIDQGDFRHREEYDANAALIALAPEMKARILTAADEIDHLRAALAAAEAERDRAMHACEQIGGRVAAAEARAEKAERERDAAREALEQIADGQTHIFEGEAVSIPLVASEAQEIASAGLSEVEKMAQARRCSCLGTDDYCPCQNVPDRQSRADRLAALTPARNEKED